MTRRLVAIGNPDRGDDAAGIEVGRRVHTWQVAYATAGSFEVIEEWEAGDEVAIVDAMRSEAAPGTVIAYDALAGDVPMGLFASTHSFGPASLVQLAKATSHVPASLMIYGIEARQIAHGAPLSEEVAAAVEQLVEELDHA